MQIEKKDCFSLDQIVTVCYFYDDAAATDLSVWFWAAQLVFPGHVISSIPHSSLTCQSTYGAVKTDLLPDHLVHRKPCPLATMSATSVRYREAFSFISRLLDCWDLIYFSRPYHLVCSRLLIARRRISAKVWTFSTLI